MPLLGLCDVLELGINRYIMECKFEKVFFLSHAYCELIDTLWNVNEGRQKTFYFGNVELIDTLWNVNHIIINCLTFGISELIDTLWNVN